MAVAVKPSPPSRIAVAARVFVHLVLSWMPAFERVLLVAARALTYLGIATCWVFSAGSAATPVPMAPPSPSFSRRSGARLAWPSSASQPCCSAACASPLLQMYLNLVQSPRRAPLQQSGRSRLRSQDSFKLPRAVILGFVASPPYTLLIVAGFLVMMMSSPVEGSISQGEIIGSVIVDVGRFGIHAISFLVIIPASALEFWRLTNRKEKQDSPCQIVETPSRGYIRNPRSTIQIRLSLQLSCQIYP